MLWKVRNELRGGFPMAKPGVMFYFDVRPCIKRLSIEEKGQLFEAILDYAEFEKVPDLDGALGVAWDFIQPKLDQDAKRYIKQVAQKQYATFVREAKKRGEVPMLFEEWVTLPDGERERLISPGIEMNRLISADTERYPTNNLQLATSNYQHTTSKNSKIEGDKPPTRHTFSPPSVEEVRAYCTEKGYGIDPERFVDYYTSNGWMVGKSKMRNWKAAVRNWNKREEPKNEPRKIESQPTFRVGTYV